MSSLTIVIGIFPIQNITSKTLHSLLIALVLLKMFMNITQQNGIQIEMNKGVHIQV